MKDRNERAWIYCRTANHNKTALDVQKSALMEYAKNNGYTLEGSTTDVGNGRELNRKALKLISEAAENDLMDVLVMENITQLCTSVRLLTEYVRWLEKCGVTLVCVDGTTLESYQNDIALDLKEIFFSALSA